jgi:hypothetical protein
MVFRNLSFLLAPFGIAYSAHGRTNKPVKYPGRFQGATIAPKELKTPSLF